MRPTRRPRLAPCLVVKDASSFVGFIERALDGRATFVEKGSRGSIT